MSLIAQILAEGPRTRSSWNDRFQYWQRPASETEEAQIGRAAAMVRTALAGNGWLQSKGVAVAAQGSYLNNTNVRLESDMDLRAVHPLIRIEYHQNVVVECAQRAHQIPQSGRYFTDVVAGMRREIVTALQAKFGATNVDGSANKAIRLRKLPGSRSDVDVVPAFTYIWMWWNASACRYERVEGVAILAKNGVWTNNFPDQHYANGVAKRSQTAHRFKRQVRIFKRIRDELVRERKLAAGRAPSFLIESLTYAAEDAYFLVDGDDRYGRTTRILYRIWELLNDPAWTASATEINGIKFLFRATQPWTLDGAREFVADALAQLRV
jgi:hypothetical protein